MAVGRAIVISGLSGSGKSTAIKALEDLGYFCVDNLLVPLVEQFIDLCAKDPSIHNVAMVMDLREPNFIQTYREAFDRIRARGHRLDVLFLDCSDENLVLRYSETRRRHPLAQHHALIDNIREERRLLSDLRDKAGLVLDTTDLNVHQLKQRVQDFAAGSDRGMPLTLFSFGFKHGLPLDAHYVFDMRHLPNPHFIDGLRPLTGKDRPVRVYLAAQPEVRALLGRLARFVRYVIPLHEAEGKPVLTVAIGCTGGRHRSVYVAEQLASRLRRHGQRVHVVHRDVQR